MQELELKFNFEKNKYESELKKYSNNLENKNSENLELKELIQLQKTQIEEIFSEVFSLKQKIFFYFYFLNFC